jgi:rSAM/selenodomain-associated transferase 2
MVWPTDPLRAYPHRTWPPLPKRPRISAVVPVLDEAQRIRGQIQHLRSLGVDEVLVVDGGSRDDSVLLARAAGATVLTTKPGRSHQLDHGAKAAAGHILWFVHADARPPPSARDAILRALRDPLVVGGAFRIQTVNDAAPSTIDPLLPIADLRAFYTLLPYGDQALFVRRDAYVAVDGYPQQPLFEDVALARRLWRVGRLRILPERVAVSGRRFVQHPVRSTLIMNLFPIAWVLGVNPDTLARWYTAVR